MLFSQVTGQDALKTLLIQSVQTGRVSHAQLLLGPLGHGGLPLALAYAQYLNCTNRTETDSCGTCPSCVKAQKLVHPDIHFSFPFPAIEGRKKCVEFMAEWREVLLGNAYITLKDWLLRFEAENKQANIPIAECQDIQRKLNMKAFEAEYKVMIIWLPEYLGKEGNTLLKILEEPPENTLFLLVAENHDMILNTILSRTQMIKMPSIGLEALAQVVQTQFDLEPDDAYRIAGLASGNQAMAFQLALHAANENTEVFRRWIELLMAGPRELLALNNWIEAFAKSGREAQKNFFNYALYMIEEMTRMYVLGQDSQLLSKQELVLVRHMMALAKDRMALEEFTNLIEKCHYYIERNGNPKVLMLNLSIQVGRLFRKKNLILSV
jgi:DNA polymerase-3 subunit delta'